MKIHGKLGDKHNLQKQNHGGTKEQKILEISDAPKTPTGRAAPHL